MLRQLLALAVVLLASSPSFAQVPKAVSPDGKLVATAKDKIVTVSTAQRPRVLMMMRGHTNDVTALSYSPDGKLLASGDKGGAVRVFDSATGKEIIRFEGKAAVTGLAFSPDGKNLAIVAGKDSKKLDLATGAVVK